MARYLAKLDEKNNIVIDVIKVGGVECCDDNGNIVEEKAIAYIKVFLPMVIKIINLLQVWKYSSQPN